MDFLSKDNNAIIRSFVKKTSFLSYELKINNTILIKPDTYMNLSGECVYKYMQFYKTNCNDLVVIHDDVDLPFSSLRYKIAGGSGGHNGLKSCDRLVGANYFRIRIGIGRHDDMDVSSFVLSDFTNEQKDILNDEVFPKAKNALYSFIDGEDINKIKSNFSINIKTKEI